MDSSAAVNPTTSAAINRPPEESWLQRHPLLAFAGTAIGLTWTVQLTFLALGWPLGCQRGRCDRCRG